MFSCEFCEIFKNTLFTEHLRATTSDLQLRDKTFSIHHKNIQSFTFEIYKFVVMIWNNEQRVSFKRKQPIQFEKCIWALPSQPKNSKIRYMNNLVFSAKNMVYSNSEHRRKHFHIFLQNKSKKMEIRLPLSALEEIFATCWFCLKVIFIFLFNPLYEEAYSESNQTSRTDLSTYIGNSASPWIILTGSSTEYVWLGSEYTSETSESP